MVVSEIHIRYEEADARLLPLLRHRVFHVTCAANLPAILASGRISANLDGTLPTAFGASRNSFFRLRDCVSVFDYRTATDEEIDKSLTKCTPWQAGRMCGFEIAIFFLNNAAGSRLEPWPLWKTTESYRQMVVPYVEAGHPGPIPLASIDELLKVTLHYEPSPLVLALQAARQRR